MAFMEQKILVAVSLDLEKAFDLMWAKGTLIQLQKYGITGKFFSGYVVSSKTEKFRYGWEISYQNNMT